MIWLILATFVVVFIVGFRVLTSDTRRAIRRLSERLNIDVVPIESMIDQMGKTAGGEFLQYLHRPDESHLQNAAQVLLIWQMVIVDGGDQNLQRWQRSEFAAVASVAAKSAFSRADHRYTGTAGAGLFARNGTRYAGDQCVSTAL